MQLGFSPWTFFLPLQPVIILFKLYLHVPCFNTLTNRWFHIVTFYPIQLILLTHHMHLPSIPEFTLPYIFTPSLPKLSCCMNALGVSKILLEWASSDPVAICILEFKFRFASSSLHIFSSRKVSNCAII